MWVNKEQFEQELILHIQGRIDAATSQEIESEIVSAFREHQNIVLDFADVEYISSAGLRALLIGHKTAISKGSHMILKNVSAVVNEMFVMTGFDKVLNVK